MADTKITEPFAISLVAGRYYIYDVDVVTYVRRKYHMPGVLIGTLPQAPQQNIFLGLPLQLLPEEARLLVEKGAAYIVDDVSDHKDAFLLSGMSKEERKLFEKMLERQGREIAMAHVRRAEEQKELALRKQTIEMKRKREARQKTAGSSVPEEDGSLFSAPTESLSRSKSPTPSISSTASGINFTSHVITPATSHPVLPKQSDPSVSLPLPPVPRSYPLYRYLHDRDYFVSPGMRFGCNYLVYPGDPLRYHSHFLAVGKEWDEEIPLLDLVGGGRLGTGVKKGFCVGGRVVEEDGEDTGEQRAFVIEWAAM